MTNNSNGNRLERIETALEVITQAVNQNQQQIATAFEAIDRLANVQLQLGAIVDRERERTNQVLARQDEIINSINAELDRQGRILDYLMRRDRNGNGDEPLA